MGPLSSGVPNTTLRFGGVAHGVFTSRRLPDVSMSKRAAQPTENLTEQMVRKMLKDLKEEHGFAPQNFSGKSLRAGGATSYVASDRSTADTLANTGHKNLATTLIYANTAGTTGNALSNTAVITDRDLKRSLPVNQFVHGAAGARKK